MARIVVGGRTEAILSSSSGCRMWPLVTLPCHDCVRFAKPLPMPRCVPKQLKEVEGADAAFLATAICHDLVHIVERVGNHHGPANSSKLPMLQAEEEAADAAFLASEEEDGGAHPGKRFRKEKPARRRRPEEATFESAGGPANKRFAPPTSFGRVRLFACLWCAQHLRASQLPGAGILWKPHEGKWFAMGKNSRFLRKAQSVAFGYNRLNFAWLCQAG